MYVQYIKFPNKVLSFSSLIEFNSVLKLTYRTSFSTMSSIIPMKNLFTANRICYRGLSGLSHVNNMTGSPVMVDVSNKQSTLRLAHARVSKQLPRHYVMELYFNYYLLIGNRYTSTGIMFICSRPATFISINF